MKGILFLLVGFISCTYGFSQEENPQLNKKYFYSSLFELPVQFEYLGKLPSDHISYYHDSKKRKQKDDKTKRVYEFGFSENTKLVYHNYKILKHSKDTAKYKFKEIAYLQLNEFKLDYLDSLVEDMPMDSIDSIINASFYDNCLKKSNKLRVYSKVHNRRKMTLLFKTQKDAIAVRIKLKRKFVYVEKKDFYKDEFKDMIYKYFLSDLRLYYKYEPNSKRFSCEVISGDCVR